MFGRMAYPKLYDSEFETVGMLTLIAFANNASVKHSKGKGLDTCYCAAYMCQTRDHQRFTISEVAADWREPMVPQRIMWPSIARANGQLDPQCS